jgi:hypothetical protein
MTDQLAQGAMFIKGTQRELSEITFHLSSLVEEMNMNREEVAKYVLQHGLNIAKHKLIIKGVGTFPIFPEVYTVLSEMMAQLQALHLLEPEQEYTVFKQISLDKSP